MSLMNTIRDKQLEARKLKSPLASLFTTLLGEASIIGKNDGNRETTDAEVIAVVKKFIKNIDETLTHLQNSIDDALTDRREELNAERDALEQFLPKQMTEAELTKACFAIKAEIGATGPKDMGKIMGLLKQRFDGQYDGKMASTVVKTVLTG